MRPIDVLNSPWAIMPEKLIEIGEIYCRHVRGETIDLREFKRKLEADGKPAGKRMGYSVVDGVAILPIEGVIAKRMNMFMEISGGTSTQMLRKDLDAALKDSNVSSIVLLIDSPGGEVDGTQSMADAVYAARGNGKPIYAFADSLMASAAYWIGSAADAVFMSDDTTSIGSIGVIATHVDVSVANERRGLKITEITAGKYKRIASENAPLTDEGRESIQGVVDHIYSVFVDGVARNRGTSTEDVLNNMADGRLFTGKQAVEAGLADGIVSLDDLIGSIRDGELAMSPSAKNKIGAEAAVEVPVVDSPALADEKPVVEVAEPLPGSEEVEPTPDQEDDTTPTPLAAPSEEGEDKMFEEQIKQIKQILGLSEDTDVVVALKEAAEKSRKSLSLSDAQGGDAVVNLTDYIVMQQAVTAAEKKVADAQKQMSDQQVAHQLQIRQRDAKDKILQAASAAKLGPKMRAWAEKLALDDPAMFDEIMLTMPRLVNVDDKGGEGNTIVLAATDQMGHEIDARQEAARKANKPVPNTGECLLAIAKENPALYEAWAEEQRQAARFEE